jgi:hypothetical protein
MSHTVWHSIFRVFVIDENSGWLGNACFACHRCSFFVTIAGIIIAMGMMYDGEHNVLFAMMSTRAAGSAVRTYYMYCLLGQRNYLCQ